MIFPQFEGVKPQDVRKPETSNLEHLLQLGKEILTEPDLKETQDYLKARKNYENRASRINYDTGDIESFILAHADKTYTAKEWQRLGILTGALVSALTQKQAQTTINVDLGNKTFHYLFVWTRKANNIIVKNLTGDHAFLFAGSHKGIIESITGINITGNAAFEFAGGDEGSVRNITGINITGNGAFWCAGNHKGCIESITGINITGKNVFWYAGSSEGCVGVVRHYDIEGPNQFRADEIREKILLTPQQAEKYLERFVHLGKLQWY